MSYIWTAAFLSAMLSSAVCNVQFKNPTDVFQPLATMTNDRNANIDKLYVAMDKRGVVEGIRFLPGGSPCPADFTNAQISSPDGANLENDEHKPIMLHANFNPNSNQTAFVVDYLSNGLWGTYKTCRAEVVRDSKGVWHLINTYTNTPVTHLSVKTWTLGISTIDGICPTN